MEHIAPDIDDRLRFVLAAAPRLAFASVMSASGSGRVGLAKEAYELAGIWEEGKKSDELLIHDACHTSVDLEMSGKDDAWFREESLKRLGEARTILDEWPEDVTKP